MNKNNIYKNDTCSCGRFFESERYSIICDKCYELATKEREECKCLEGRRIFKEGKYYFVCNECGKEHEIK